jgi:hypothetical protein
MEAKTETRVTVPSPLCHFDRPPDHAGVWRCHRAGRAVLGRKRVKVGCINRTITCLTCGCHGEQSENTERKR